MTNPRSPNCEHCHGTGWREVEVGGYGAENARGVTQCDCTVATEAKNRLMISGIPSRFKNIAEEGPIRPKKGQKVALQRTHKFVDGWFPGDKRKGILFVGPNGCGKTFLACFILKGLITERCAVGRFVDSSELLDRIRSSYDRASSTMDREREMDIVEPLKQCDVLVLDDIGAHRTSGWVQDIFFGLINSRYNDMKTTIVTTNHYDMDDAEIHPDQSLEGRLGLRVRSRLYEMCERVVIEADDVRKEK